MIRSGRKILIVFAIILSSAMAKDILAVYHGPTALGLDQGSFQVNLNIYQQGGLGIKTGVSFSPHFHLGFIEHIEAVVGNGDPQWNIPGLYGKISFPALPIEKFNFALGWDSIFAGQSFEYLEPVYGPYFVFTKGFSIGKGKPHFFSIGEKVILTKNPIRFLTYAHVYFRFFHFLEYGFEIDNLSFDKTARYDIINTHSFSVNLSPEVSLVFNFEFLLKFDQLAHQEFEEINSRSIQVIYQSYF